MAEFLYSPAALSTGIRSFLESTQWVVNRSGFTHILFCFFSVPASRLQSHSNKFTKSMTHKKVHHAVDVSYDKWSKITHS